MTTPASLGKVGEAASMPVVFADDGAPCSLGVSGARFTSADASAAAVAVTDAPAAGKKLVLEDLFWSSDTALRLDFSEETSGTILFSVRVAANGSGQFNMRKKVRLATADKKLMVRASASGNIYVTAIYRSDS